MPPVIQFKKKFRQVTTAVADGTIAALSASEYINNIKKEITEYELAQSEVVNESN